MPRLLRQTRLCIAALLIAALTLLPVFDAMACAFEAPTLSGEVVDGGQSGDSGKTGEPAGAKDHLPGVCEHNHCHHCSANVLPGLAAAPASHALRQLPIGHPRALALADLVDNLMRPPRS